MMKQSSIQWVVVAALMAMGCGEMGGSGDGGSGVSCTTDASCGTGKGCHPVLKQCVSTCTSTSDCSNAAEKNCQKIQNSALSFCTCTNDQLCNQAVTGQVCSSATKQCTAKCSTSGQCPTGFSCNADAGQCAGGPSSDAGTTTDAGTTCNSSLNVQPERCAYGSVCSSTNICQGVVDGTCPNIADAKNPAAPTQARPAFNPATSTGPIVYSVVDEATNDDAFCGAGTNAFTVTLSAYAAQGTTFPATKTGLPQLYYFNSQGTPSDALASIRPSDYTQLDNGRMMRAKITLCSSAASSLTAGFGFANGNGYCVTAVR